MKHIDRFNLVERQEDNGNRFEESTFDTLINEIIQFRDERNWKQFHNPKDLAISLSLEASELLENFQWKSSDDAIEENIDNIKDEIADVVIYAMLFSHELGINLEQAIKEKIQKNKQKYPVDKAFGSRKKYTEF
ncbi:nucleotide pyrophosphohydrolase [Pallidibacillus thermolactis]|jgi:NTP pyrophosphatase (non-canonical NTP hydrolase)|uniref:nucleotide pyrophosphohydrolase n=1 Tax=Pallidibacillus thermolactis TaxID=251051 RepID=UPI002E1B5F92|nr:nucleotide pyrophosphohydrolase [Pallidibacillus thermolactis subsp. kokeshiiformis]